ncbi:hypothetical protein SAMN04488553_0181 [Gramella sp. MAR_2010_147]|nr:hypothetical protein SAMN04488553_0181 [Gramella sp. MAR_2010_147]
MEFLKLPEMSIYNFLEFYRLVSQYILGNSKINSERKDRDYYLRKAALYFFALNV